MNLFNSKPKKAVRAYRVENLNPSKGISSSMRVSKDQKQYVVCLCLFNKTVRTTFPNEHSALEQMRKYRTLYKEISVKGQKKTVNGNIILVIDCYININIFIFVSQSTIQRYLSLCIEQFLQGFYVMFLNFLLPACEGVGEFLNNSDISDK